MTTSFITRIRISEGDEGFIIHKKNVTNLLEIKIMSPGVVVVLMKIKISGRYRLKIIQAYKVEIN